MAGKKSSESYTRLTFLENKLQKYWITYKQAVRGLFTIGTSTARLKLCQNGSIVAKFLKIRRQATAVKGKRSVANGD